MATRKLGIIMNGVTGRMGLNQHLVRSIVAIRKQGGVPLPNGDRLVPDPAFGIEDPRRRSHGDNIWNGPTTEGPGGELHRVDRLQSLCPAGGADQSDHLVV